MTFRNLNLTRFIGLDPVANILYPALLAVWVVFSVIMAGSVFLMTDPLRFFTMVALMLLFLCVLYASGYRHYLQAKFEKPDDAIFAPGIFGLVWGYLPFVVLFIESRATIWMVAPFIVFGVLNCWLAWRMIALSVDVRYGYVKARCSC